MAVPADIGLASQSVTERGKDAMSAIIKTLLGWCLVALATMMLLACGESSATPKIGGPADQTQSTADPARPANTADTSSGLTLIPATVRPPLEDATPSLTPAPQANQVTPAPTLITTPTLTAAPMQRQTPVPASTADLATRPAPTLVPAQVALRPLAVQRAFPNLEFSRLTNLVQPDDYRLFVTQQGGRILVFPDQPDAAESNLFLDLRDRVSQGNNEEGLLGLAFAPSFRDNGYFYVYYSASNPRRSVLSRFTVDDDDSNSVDKGSELLIMEIPQPAGNTQRRATGLRTRQLFISRGR